MTQKMLFSNPIIREPHAIIAAAMEAGHIVMDVYADDFQVETKADHTPLTLADTRADAHITRALHDFDPTIPIVSEEDTAANGMGPQIEDRMKDASFWLVDPLDGTREFIKRNGEFTVNIALVYQRQPVFGVVHAPALGETYYGFVDNDKEVCGAFMTRHEHIPASPAMPPVIDAATVAEMVWEPLHCVPFVPERARAVVSRSHLNHETRALLAHMDARTELAIGSSLKFCRIATGAADFYPRFGRTMEWDTAASHALLQGAGGHVCTLNGAPLRYAKDKFENPPFIAFGNGAFPSLPTPPATLDTPSE